MGKYGKRDGYLLVTNDHRIGWIDRYLLSIIYPSAAVATGRAGSRAERLQQMMARCLNGKIEAVGVVPVWEPSSPACHVCRGGAT